MSTVSIVVTPEVRHMIESHIHGSGGFQSLCKRIATKAALDPNDVAKLSVDEFKRLVTYAANYGEGGYQQRFRQLLALWASQHLNEIVH